MIEVNNVTKRYPVHQGERTVLDDVSFTVRQGEKLGVLGRNGSGKSTLVRLIGGVELPSSGTIVRSMSVSWPIAFSGGFHGTLTGMDNIRFICRVYDTRLEDRIDFIKEFAELGSYLHEPIRTYSNGMKARLAFAISMAVEFDCYLIDEVMAVGDKIFHEKCSLELFEKRIDRSMIIVSHDIKYIEKHCRRVLVLLHGKPHLFEDIGEGFEFYHASTASRPDGKK